MLASLGKHNLDSLGKHKFASLGKHNLAKLGIHNLSTLGKYNLASVDNITWVCMPKIGSLSTFKKKITSLSHPVTYIDF